MTGLGMALVAQVFQVVGGTVRYETVVRSAAGLIPHVIRAENRDVQGTVLLRDTVLAGTLYVPVARFASGNLQRDRDVAEILDYRRYPFVQVTVKGSALPVRQALEIAKDSAKFPVDFTLTVRDCTRTFPGVMVTLVLGDTLEARVVLPTRFSDLGLDPPKVSGLGFLGGLVSRAEDTLNLEGHLRFVMREGSP